jgi:hypothetical protein
MALLVEGEEVAQVVLGKQLDNGAEPSDGARMCDRALSILEPSGKPNVGADLPGCMENWLWCISSAVSGREMDVSR